MFEELLARGTIGPFKAGRKQISNLLSAAHKDLQTAKSTAEDASDWAQVMAYSAMLQAGTALMYFYGYRPKRVEHHRSVVEFTREALGSKHSTLVRDFDRIRRYRNAMLYQGKRGTSKKDATHTIAQAKKLLKIIKKEVGAA